MKNILLNKKTLLIASGLTIATIGAVIIIRRRTFGKNLSLTIAAKLEGRENLYGNIKDYEDVFSGKSYIDKVRGIVNKNHPTLDFLMLNPTYVTKYRTELYNAMEKGNWQDFFTGYGTIEEVVKDVFKKLNDKVAIAQVAQSYQDNYKKNLLSVMEEEMDVDSDDMKEINDNISTKLPFRLTTKSKY